ncbi:MAG: PEP-CTERM sorting domain-containing protein, partial [Candidatus Nealsonbacteria bacterium]|nr:PEP-CTERM sorting domain-containing protein [Candidatus Nealsonbacteria bacterium]
DVDFGDYMILEASFGGAGEYSDGDFDFDGDVDFGDYMILEASFGDIAGAVESPSQMAAIPEPQTLTLLAIAAAFGALAAARRRRQSSTS